MKIIEKIREAAEHDAAKLEACKVTGGTLVPEAILREIKLKVEEIRPQWTELKVSECRAVEALAIKVLEAGEKAAQKAEDKLLTFLTTEH